MDRGMRPKLKAAPTLMDRQAQMLHGVAVGNIHRRKRQAACTGQAQRFDAVVKFF